MQESLGSVNEQYLTTVAATNSLSEKGLHHLLCYSVHCISRYGECWEWVGVTFIRTYFQHSNWWWWQ